MTKMQMFHSRSIIFVVFCVLASACSTPGGTPGMTLDASDPADSSDSTDGTDPSDDSDATDPDLPPPGPPNPGELFCSTINEANWYDTTCFADPEAPAECQRVTAEDSDCSVWCGCQDPNQTCDGDNRCQSVASTIPATCQTCSLFLKLHPAGQAFNELGQISTVKLDVWYNPIARELGDSAEPRAGIADFRIRTSREVLLRNAKVFEPADMERLALAAGQSAEGIPNRHKRLMVDPKTGLRWQRTDADDGPPEFRFLILGVDTTELLEPGVLMTLEFEVRDPRATAFWLPTRLPIFAPRDADDALQVDTSETGYSYSTQAIFMNRL